MSEKGLNRIKISENFSLYEFACQGEAQETCSCFGSVKIHPDLRDLLQNARDVIGKPLVVNSGYRCKTHNDSRAVNGSPVSQHMHGLAADVSIVGLGMEIDDVIDVFANQGAVRIGKYPIRKFVHVSVRDLILNGEVRARRWIIE